MRSLFGEGAGCVLVVCVAYTVEHLSNKNLVFAMKKTLAVLLSTGLAMLATGVSPVMADASPKGDWYGTIGGGWRFLEKDETVLGQQIYEVRLGHDFGKRYSWELGLGGMPDVRDRQHRRPNQRLLGEDTWGLRLAGDLLIHTKQLSNRGAFDPYFAVGTGVVYYDETVDNGHFDPFLAAGVGAFMNLNHRWFVKPDYRFEVVGADADFNHTALLALGYRWGKGLGGDDAGVRGAELDAWAKELRIVYFDFDSSELTETSKAILKKNAEWMGMHPNEPLILEGHCDERGTNEYNMALGQRRAQSVYDYLRALGVSTARLRTVSYGEEFPAQPGSGEANWSKNRRVEFRLDKNERAVAK
jgi:peptidoglycan-associated lipoprotein